MASTITSTFFYTFMFVFVLFGSFVVRTCRGFGTFGFDIHHRYSDPVKGILAVDELPEKGTLQYYAAMTHRDRVVFSRGRGLAETDAVSEPLTFYYGNETYRISSLGYLHYANVSVGTPSVWFLVALDTGSDLFWLPCDCTSCVHGLETSSGEQMELNIYSPTESSTSEKVPCSSTFCPRRNQCLSTGISCPYEVKYLSNNTSSTGYWVEDVLHLTTDDDTQAKAVDQKITLGCGQIQTGSFLDGAAPNGLFGLGMTSISVPSTLARELQIPNTFSMCFGSNAMGRISFGDKGSSDQGETPFNLMRPHSTYNISVTQVSVNGNDTDLEFTAIFDSGTSFTYLNDPAYSVISEGFNNMVNGERHSSTSDFPFEYCYDISPNQNQLEIPDIPYISLVMKGGDWFNVTDPIVVVPLLGNAYVYCLALVRSEDVNIIGVNFMTGYRIIFDRDRQVLGWMPSNCYDDMDSNTLPVNQTNSSTAVPSATAVDPEATPGSSNSSQIPVASPSSHSPQLYSLTYALMMVIIPFFAIV